MIDDPNVRYRYDMDYQLEKGCRCLCCYEHTGKWRVYDWLDKMEDELYSSEEEAIRRCEGLNDTVPDLKASEYTGGTSVVSGKLRGDS